MTRASLGHTTGEVARRTGATFRQLDYWDRAGILCASIAGADGSGSERRWSDEDVAVAAALVQLTALIRRPLFLADVAAGLRQDGALCLASDDGTVVIDVRLAVSHPPTGRRGR